MDEDKAREYLNDVTGDGYSNCCGTSVYEFGEDAICKSCGEHCEMITEKEEKNTDRAFSWEQLAQIAALEKQCIDAGCDGPDHNEHK